MSKRTIACPKCQKKYQVGPEMSGKKMKCPSCQAVFVLNFAPAKTMAASPAATTSTPQNSSPGPSSGDYQKMGLDGPLRGDAEIFPEQPVTAVNLNNYAADPGFGAVDPSRFVEDPFDPRKDNPIFDNPALSHAQQLALDIRTDSLEEKHNDKEEIGGTLRSVFSISGVFIGLILLDIVLGAMGVIPAAAWMATLLGTLFIFGLLINIYYLLFVIRTFQVAPASEALLSLFVPFYVIFFLIKYWRDVKYEALSWMFMTIALFGGTIIFFVGIIVAVMINPDLKPPS